MSPKGNTFTYSLHEFKSKLNTEFRVAVARAAEPVVNRHIDYLRRPRLEEIAFFPVPVSGDATKREYEAVFN